MTCKVHGLVKNISDNRNSIDVDVTYDVNLSYNDVTGQFPQDSMKCLSQWPSLS